jgi:hypothetical protein
MEQSFYHKQFCGEIRPSGQSIGDGSRAGKSHAPHAHFRKITETQFIMNYAVVLHA